MPIKINIRHKPSLCERCERGSVITFPSGETLVHCIRLDKRLRDFPSSCSHYRFRWTGDDESEWEKKEGIYIIKPVKKTYGNYI